MSHPDDPGPNTRTLQVPFLVLVTRADPDRQRAQVDQVEFEFTGRTFRHNPNVRGPYAPED
jgi:hypothetical protein